MVLKADGLAAGKGVVLAENYEEAEKAIEEMMGDRIFGDAADLIVVEECLRGIEASHALFRRWQDYRSDGIRPGL